MSKHTHGPWTVKPHWEGFEVSCGNGWLFVLKDSNDRSKETDRDFLETQEANARLITAAPELLEAVESAQKLAEWLAAKISRATYEAEELGNTVDAWMELSDSMHNGVMASYRDEFAAALAKARGEDASLEADRHFLGRL